MTLALLDQEAPRVKLVFQGLRDRVVLVPLASRGLQVRRDRKGNRVLLDRELRDHLDSQGRRVGGGRVEGWMGGWGCRWSAVNRSAVVL